MRISNRYYVRFCQRRKTETGMLKQRRFNILTHFETMDLTLTLMSSNVNRVIAIRRNHDSRVELPGGDDGDNNPVPINGDNNNPVPINGNTNNPVPINGNINNLATNDGHDPGTFFRYDELPMIGQLKIIDGAGVNGLDLLIDLMRTMHINPSQTQYSLATLSNTVYQSIDKSIELTKNGQIKTTDRTHCLFKPQKLGRPRKQPRTDWIAMHPSEFRISFKTDVGLTLSCCRPIHKSDAILEFVGRVLTHEEYIRMYSTTIVTPPYVMKVSNPHNESRPFAIDATFYGSLSRFIRSGPEDTRNVEFRELTSWDRKYRTFVGFAIKDIKPNIMLQC